MVVFEHSLFSVLGAFVVSLLGSDFCPDAGDFCSGAFSLLEATLSCAGCVRPTTSSSGLVLFCAGWGLFTSSGLAVNCLGLATSGKVSSALLNGLLNLIAWLDSNISERCKWT